MGLYLELATQMSDLPPMVAAYVAMMTAETTGPHIRPWRENLSIHVAAIGAFLDVVLSIDPPRGELEAQRLATLPNTKLLRR
jgi:hypothetical protein